MWLVTRARRAPGGEGAEVVDEGRVQFDDYPAVIGGGEVDGSSLGALRREGGGEGGR